MTVSESPDAWPLRAEEVGTSKTYIDVNDDWYAFCQALFQGIEGEDWGDMNEAYKEMSRAVGGEEATGGPEKHKPSGK